MPNRCPIVLTLSLAVYAAVGVTSSPVLAAAKQSSGPTTRAPHNLLRVNLVERTGKLRDQASQLDQSIRKNLDKISSAGKPGYRNFEETFGALLRYTRIGAELMALGEPAGKDVQLRQQNYRKTLFELGKKYAAGSTAKRAVDKRVAGLPRAISKSASKTSKAAKNAKNKKWRLAYDGWNQVTDPAQEMGFWHEVVKGSADKTLFNWQRQSDGYFYHVSKELREEAKRLCLEVIEKHQDGTKLIESIQNFSAALATSATADVGSGSILSGPQAVEHFGNLWIQQQRLAMRARGLAAILEFVGGGGDTDSIIAQHADFSSKIGPALAGIIQADAGRASPEEVPALYQEYLQRLPPLIARGNQAALVSLFHPPLDQLAARSPTLQADIEAFRLCTADLLRWRRRTTQAYTRAEAESYPGLDKVVQANCAAPGNPALLIRTSKGQVRAALNLPVPQLIEDARARFMDKQVSVGGLRYRKNYALSVSAVRSVAYVPTSLDTTRSARESLASDLFASDGLPPPSLKAAVALYTAETGDSTAAGGVIYHIGLATIAARYASQSADDRGLVRLGAALPSPPRPWQINDLALLFVLKPSWLAHEYFFVKLPEQ